jgi:hypothetical protein
VKKPLKPRRYKETGKRHSKTNLTKGAFGVEGNKKIIKNPFKVLEAKIPMATPKGKITSTYMRYHVNKSKTSKDYTKGK